MVKVLVGAHLISDADALHVDDLCAGQLVSVLNGTLTHLLVADGVVDSILNRVLIHSFGVIFISFVGVLVTLYSKRTKALQQIFI